MEQIGFSLICTKCHSLHDIDVQNSWGSYPGTAGLGPFVVCPAIVPKPNKQSNEVCRGLLGLHREVS